MLMQLITTDLGQVKVGNMLLPGVFESLEITGSVKLDEVEIPGKEQKVTQAVGYSPARVRLTVNLLPLDDEGDCTWQIEVYQKLFRAALNQEKPGVYRIVNKHAQARNINEVIFSDLKTFEDNRSDKVLLICEFIEHVPIQIQVRPAAPATPKPAAKPKPAPKPAVAAGGKIGMGDLRQAEIADKTAETPARDTRQPSLARRILAWLKGG